MGQATEFWQYLFGRLKDAKPVTHEVAGQAYAVKADGTLGDAVRGLAPQWVKPGMLFTTLDGLVGAYRSKIDDFSERVALHVHSPTVVSLVSLVADEYGNRHVFAQAFCKLECPFKFNTYLDSESFLIAFRASCNFNENAVQIQRLLSTLANESSVSVSDDGISQTVTTKSGAITRASIELPAEIPLVFWRTFREAAPVESKYLLRLKGEPGKVPTVALFEIDAKWQLDTVRSVAAYLAEQLPDATILI
ncbi:MAG: hypothetical protein ACYDC6_12465 [Acidobacteriaceae bacterium]